MGKKVKEFLSWWNDGIDYKEFLALIIISIFGYLVYFVCKKMMNAGLEELDIEFLKIISTNIVIILVFYYGSGSAENIIQSLFNVKNKKMNRDNSDVGE